ncbi:MAG: aminodeoxychorismate synthase component I [Chthoniobacteraceae bacterium]
MPALAANKPAQPVALDLAPAEVAARLRHLPGLAFFDTAKFDGDANALSIVAAAPREILRGHIARDWDALRDALAARECAHGGDDGLPHGLAAGRVDYDGAFCFGFYDEALLYRHADERWYSTGDLVSRMAATPCDTVCVRPEFQSRMPREEFLAMVRRAQEYIAAGDIYQVNLSHRFASPWSGEPWAFYEALRHYSPAPNAAFLDLGGTAVLSTSPESFLKMSGRAIRTRPIKGTRPRRADPLADERSAFDLLTSAKEVAELVMITDLERNDLGIVCDFGSVAVPELLKLERHEQVFHLVSTVEGRLRAGVDHAAAFRACFPGGSITGAPKRRAREIIAELEPAPRGLYTGALGWFGFNGESQFSIAIRTVVIGDGEAHFQVGSGIVADSSPEAEWQETLDKAAGILLAAGRL